MSPRNFARAFTRELDVTPATYVESARIEAACRRLEVSDDSMEHVALDVGFGTAETLRRAFKRVLGISPAQYRQLRRRDPEASSGDRRAAPRALSKLSYLSQRPPL